MSHFPLVSRFWSILSFLARVSFFFIPVSSICWVHVFMSLNFLLFLILLASFTLFDHSLYYLLFWKCTFILKMNVFSWLVFKVCIGSYRSSHYLTSKFIKSCYSYYSFVRSHFSCVHHTNELALSVCYCFIKM